MLFQHGAETVGLPSKEQWTEVLQHARRHGWTLGADLDQFPSDFAHLARYDDAIRRQIPARYPMPAPLALDDMERFLANYGDHYAVRLS